MAKKALYNKPWQNKTDPMEGIIVHDIN